MRETRTEQSLRRAAAASVLAAVGLCAWQSPARGQVFQPDWSARPVSADSPALGVAAGFGDSMFRIAGHGRFSISSASDLGIELAFDNIEDNVGDDSHFFGPAVDLKYLVIAEGDRLPFDFAAQAGAGMQWGSDVRFLTVPFGVLGSKTIDVDEGRLITPFAAAYVIVEHVTVDLPGGRDDSDTDVELEIRFGSAFQVTGNNHAFAALHIGNGTKFFLGFTAGL